MELGQIVGAHDPDELCIRKSFLQITKRIDGVDACALALERRHIDPRMVRNLDTLGQSFFQGPEFRFVLQRVAR